MIFCFFFVETTVHEKWLPAETLPVILLPAQTLSRKLNHTDSLCRKLFTEHNSLGGKQEIPSVSAETKYDSLCRKGKLANSFIPCVLVTGETKMSGKSAHNQRQSKFLKEVENLKLSLPRLSPPKLT